MRVGNIMKDRIYFGSVHMVFRVKMAKDVWQPQAEHNSSYYINPIWM